jgi:hypothetical protein
MEYTPAPWEWNEDRFNGGYSGITNAAGEEVLFPNCRNEGDDGEAWFEEFPNEADRILIAAAPELLEHLELLVKEAYLMDSDCELNPIIDGCKQLIKKARGK